MNRIVNFLQKYFAVISVLIGISILLSVTFSSYIVTSNNHKAAEMYIGTLKYSIEINGSTTNTLSVPTGETIIDVKVNNQNPVDTYYKLLYLKNTNITVKYYESTKDTNDVVTTYNKPNDSITSSNSNTIKLLITNNSASSQNIALTMKGGYITNTIQDIITPSTYSEITLVETPSTNTYFCTTTDTLTQGLKYVNGQYTYAYKQEGYYASSGLSWSNMANNGWGVQLTDKASTDAVTSSLCTYINNKPVVSMAYMFSGTKATTLDVSNFYTSKVTNMHFMFLDSQATTLDVSNFDTSKVTDMFGMFSGTKATTIDVSNFDTSKVTSMRQMFNKSQAITIDLSNFDTSNVTDMQFMFSNSQATILDLSSFDTSSVTDMSSMFFYSKATTLDLSNFDTSNVTNMVAMFDHSKATALDLSSFNTSNVINMSNMFWYSQATKINGLNKFNTSNVTKMNSMFSNSKATTLDLSNFNTSKVTDMSNMFSSSTNLKTIYASDKFVTTKVTSSTNIFTGCTNLVGGAGTKYNSSHVDKTYARIDGGTSRPGYFTDIADKDIPAPNSFAADSWKTIIKAVRNNNISKYNVGDTRTIDMGTYGTHTLRIANKSKPSSCSKSGYSQTACGFVLEFADIITTYNMNPAGTYKNVEYEYGWNKDGWPASAMRTFVNNDIYNSLPSDLRSGIVETTVVSGYGSSDSANFTSTDKLYLLSPMEVWGDWTGMYGSEVDRAKNQTRQLDYYNNLGVTYNNYNSAIKKHGTSQYFWWHRSAKYDNNIGFYGMRGNGYAYRDGGVSPAFRIG